jgi:DNA-binding MarR family transcriptional regulator
VESLEQAGYVARSTDLRFYQRVLVQPTAEGKRAFERADRALERSALSKSLSGGQDELLDALRRLEDSWART